mgnify:CR=1 FL=1
MAQEVRNLMQGEAVYPVSDRYAAGFPANLGEVVESDTEAGRVKSYVFVDPADLGNLFQILVALLV